VKRLKAAWPTTKVVLRADSGFCRDRMLTWRDQNDVQYVVGIARKSPKSDRALKVDPPKTTS
jgi:hypothetical protein